MPKLKPRTIIPTDEEDAAINAGIKADPDTYELSDEANLHPIGRPKAEVIKELSFPRWSVNAIKLSQT